jgi:hypothetical protein
MEEATRAPTVGAHCKEATMGVHVKAVDRSDWVGKLAAASRLDEIYMSDTLSLVVNVLAHLRKKAPYSRVCAPGYAQSSKMSRLDIVDHGSETHVGIGTDDITVTNFDLQFRAILLPLAMHFDKNGFAHLQNCNAGANVPLLEKFADTWGVPVVAGKGSDVELGVTQINMDKYVRVYPANGSGRPKQDTFRWRP